jgi:hypothetical protein
MVYYVLCCHYTLNGQRILEQFEDYEPARQYTMYHQLRTWTNVNDYTLTQTIIMTKIPPIAATRNDNIYHILFSDILALREPSYLPAKEKSQYLKDCIDLKLYLKQTKNPVAVL